MPTIKRPTIRKTSKPAAKAQKAVKKTVAPKKTAAKPIVRAHSASSVRELPKQTGLKLSVYGTSGRSAETISLPKEIFEAKINSDLMAQAVRVYLANQRGGTVRTKSRGEVKISTKKIYRQKGTGRARHGAASAPIFVGGGIAFGPKPRDYSLKLPQKAKRAALFSALSAKLKDGAIIVVSGLEKLEPKTKNMADVINKLSLNEKNKRILLVTPSFALSGAERSDSKKTPASKRTEPEVKHNEELRNISRMAKNIEGVSILPSNLLNTYEILANRRILFMKNSIDSLKENFLKD